MEYARRVEYWNGRRFVSPKDPDYDARMGDWIHRNMSNPRVQRWLRQNPPPLSWRGTEIEYAYTEMPFAPR